MDYAAYLAEYKQMRQAAELIIAAASRMLKKEDLEAAARATGLRHGNDVVRFGNPVEIMVLADYAIHEMFRDGQNAVDRLAEQRTPADGSAEMLVLRAFRRARYELVSVKSTVPGVGLMGEGFSIDAPFLLMDINLSRSAVVNSAFAARIFSPTGEWWMTTGSLLPLNHDSLGRIIAEMNDYASRHDGQEPRGAERTGMIIRSCLASGASRRVTAAAPGVAAPAAHAETVRAAPRVGRNDPCPCGSGKKYKKCCGA